MKPSKTITLQEAASRLGVSRQRATVFCHEGRFSCRLVTHQTGFRSWEIDKDSLLKFASKKRTPCLHLGGKRG